MKTHPLLITTILSTSLILSAAASSLAADITTGTVGTATKPISNETISNPRIAASSFVEHINYARVALAMKNTDLARQHLVQAHNLITVIKHSTIEHRRVTQVESGRIIYQYDTEYKYHYFPIETGPVQVKKVSSGPIWAVNDLAVTDADIVYLTLDLTGDKADSFLRDADTAITNGKLKEADNQLAMLTDAVVKIDSQVSVPSDKAHDNIALARNFIAGKNYTGARYALKHADEALNEMQDNASYKAYRPDIINMRKDVSDLQNYIDKKDPTMIEKTDKKFEKWGKELKRWSARR
ncbi:MAG: YfdX family protein [Alphaproteobacteria bacterium]|nr:YfdX family protein [Alphaproteobacteria bacterium]